ncbi:hypothetical protein Tco_1079775 [Tanacetum coccineum]|uniref:Uncharacterized protein n=1 Tax=Tanacetum coccineum TaxID=301880 RepID=A0ABQ5HU98_9ASTR
MNPQETEQVIARDELWVPTAERVNISTTNVRLETTVKAKEEPSIGIDRTRILTSSRHSPFLRMCVIDAEVFRKILDICPRKEGEDFTEVQNDEDTLTFLVDLGYSGPLHKYTNMFVDHMHQPWRTLAACINKCLSGKTASNDKLRKSRIDILWGMFYRENHKSLKKLKFQHFHTIKDDGVVSRLKFVRMGEDVQQYGLVILATMLNNEIIQLESYKMFILHSTGQIPPKKSRGKGSQWKKTADLTEESVDVSDKIISESVPEPARRRRSDIAIYETTQKLKGIQTLTPAEQEAADIIIAPQDNKECLGMTSWINVRKNADTEMKDAEKTADITKETTEQPLTSSSFSVPSDYGNQFLNLSHNEEIFEQPPKIDHSAAILASIQSYVPLVIDKYVGTKLDDALLKALERHTADLVEKYFVLPTPESSKNLKRVQKRLSESKRNNEEKKQEPTYTIKSTDKAALEEFDLKSALFKSMHKTMICNRKYCQITDDIILSWKYCPPAGSNQGKSIKRRRTRESESAKKPYTTKESSKDKDSNMGSKTGKSAPAKDPVEEPTDEVIMDEQPTEDIPISDEGHVSDPEDTDNAHMPKANAFAKAHQDPDENKLHNKIDDIGSFIRWYCRRIGKEELSKADLEGPAFMMINLVNPEGHQIVPHISNPLPLGGPLGQVTIQPQLFFNKDQEYLLTADKERNRALSISNLKAALY